MQPIHGVPVATQVEAAAHGREEVAEARLFTHSAAAKERDPSQGDPHIGCARGVSRYHDTQTTARWPGVLHAVCWAKTGGTCGGGGGRDGGEQRAISSEPPKTVGWVCLKSCTPPPPPSPQPHTQNPMQHVHKTRRKCMHICRWRATKNAATATARLANRALEVLGRANDQVNNKATGNNIEQKEPPATHPPTPSHPGRHSPSG